MSTRTTRCSSEVPNDPESVCVLLLHLRINYIITTLQYYYISILQHYNITILRYYSDVLLYYNITILQHFDITILPYYSDIILLAAEFQIKSLLSNEFVTTRWFLHCEAMMSYRWSDRIERLCIFCLDTSCWLITRPYIVNKYICFQSFHKFLGLRLTVSVQEMNVSMLCPLKWCKHDGVSEWRREAESGYRSALQQQAILTVEQPGGQQGVLLLWGTALEWLPRFNSDKGTWTHTCSAEHIQTRWRAIT